MMRVRLLWVTFRNLKGYYFILPIIVFGLVPLFVYLRVKTYGLEQSNIENISQMFIPVASTWWIFCILKEYIEGEGCELLYSYMDKKKSKLQDVLLVFLWQGLHVVVLFLTMSIWLDNMALEAVRILVQSFFLIGLYYALIYAFKSTAISYMIVLCYYFMGLFLSGKQSFGYYKLLNILNIFSSKDPMTFDMLENQYMFIFGIAVLLYAIGYMINRRYQRLFEKN